MNASAATPPTATAPVAPAALSLPLAKPEQRFEPVAICAQTGKTRVLDPYLHWARLTGYRYLARRAAQRLRVAWARRATAAANKPDATCAGDTNYGTALVDPLSPAALAELLERADFVLAEPGLWPIDRPAAATLPEPVTDNAVHDPACGGRGLVIGVIDGRCGFAHRNFCDPAAPTRSTIDSFWDQGQDAAQPWRVPAGFGYGRELRRQDLDTALERYISADATDWQRAEEERVLYRALGQALPEDADWSHGTHVLDTVLSDHRARRLKPVAGGRPGIVYVQLPDDALRDTSARWAAAYVFDALRYILCCAGKAAQVVVNVSLGAFAGPHDGSSLLERAIDELIDLHGGRLRVVVAAGNTGHIRDDATGRAVPCHARVTLASALGPECDKGMESVDLAWDIDCADSTESFMEIWLPQIGRDGQHAAVEVALRHVDSLSGEPDADCASAMPGHIDTLASGGQVMAAVLNASGGFQAPNGSGGMVLVALGHTRDTRRPCARMGRWIVTVTNKSPWPITLDACIERRDLPGELAGFRPQYGFGPATPGLEPGGALGSLANGKKTIVVGAAQREKADAPFTPSSYSAGAARGSAGECNARAVWRRGPDLFAVGQREAAGFLSGSKKSLAGTSMAAAQVSAALAASLAPAAKGYPAESAGNVLDRLGTLAAKQEPAGSSGPMSPPRLAGVDARLAAFVLPALQPGPIVPTNAPAAAAAATRGARPGERSRRPPGPSSGG